MACMDTDQSLDHATMNWTILDKIWLILTCKVTTEPLWINYD